MCTSQSEAEKPGTGGRDFPDLFGIEMKTHNPLYFAQA